MDNVYRRIIKSADKLKADYLKLQASCPVMCGSYVVVEASSFDKRITDLEEIKELASAIAAERGISL